MSDHGGCHQETLAGTWPGCCVVQGPAQTTACCEGQDEPLLPERLDWENSAVSLCAPLALRVTQLGPHCPLQSPCSGSGYSDGAVLPAQRLGPFLTRTPRLPWPWGTAGR